MNNLFCSGQVLFVSVVCWNVEKLSRKEVWGSSPLNQGPGRHLPSWNDLPQSVGLPCIRRCQPMEPRLIQCIPVVDFSLNFDWAIISQLTNTTCNKDKSCFSLKVFSTQVLAFIVSKISAEQMTKRRVLLQDSATGPVGYRFLFWRNTRITHKIETEIVKVLDKSSSQMLTWGPNTLGRSFVFRQKSLLPHLCLTINHVANRQKIGLVMDLCLKLAQLVQQDLPISRAARFTMRMSLRWMLRKICVPSDK